MIIDLIQINISPRFTAILQGSKIDSIDHPPRYQSSTSISIIKLDINHRPSSPAHPGGSYMQTSCASWLRILPID
ncbi:hypothetical protein PGT21_020488 [Puccinia graminis f. sp. tritici]|uniref:Uncharacterized protein n=1 Tax=Puccinia graminis f. sp. tritici TaxID=56615 RepID=A0A5B0QIN9_PUCGR|nr:hypothetical protein PGT21_020488 [Puccinia graminis f. sp. tritici]